MIALLSDFGMGDIYVGVMKSVIETIAPGTVVVDITHDIPAHDVRSGSFALRGAMPYMPAGTVIVAVVDPGVGSERNPIAVRSGKTWVTGPDNGLLTGVKFDQAVLLDNPTVYRQGNPSSTFHGRDIFAPAAAHLSLSQDISTIGSAIEPKTIISLERATIHRTDSALTGEVQHVDRFGNIITNITPDILSVWASDTSEFVVVCGSMALPAKRTGSYADGIGFEGVILIPDSFGMIEIAAANSSASRQLGGVKTGQVIAIKRA